MLKTYWQIWAKNGKYCHTSWYRILGLSDAVRQPLFFDYYVESNSGEVKNAKKHENFYCFLSFLAYICGVNNPQKRMTQKEIIVEHAMKMFVAQGVKAVRMDDIAQELSVSKRTLYEMFSDKEELLYQSIELYIERSVERRQQQVMSVDNDLEVMLLCLRDMVTHAPVASRMRRNLHRFYPKVYERLEANGNKKSADDLKRWLKRCVEAGYMTTTADCDFVVKVLNDSVQGMLVSDLYESRDSVEMVSMMSYSLVIFIRGLCTVQGLEIIDSCFDKYFGNIPSPDTL